VFVRIETFLDHSPMFAISRAGRRAESLASRLLAQDELNFLEGLVLAALFLEAPRAVKPSTLAETFCTSRSNVSHCLSSLEARTLIQRRIDPEDARAYSIVLKPAGKRAALRVIAAFDAMQRRYEEEVGKPALRQMLEIVRCLDVLSTR
jgi:DNA-binding MarR family transcriptional regulator